MKKIVFIIAAVVLIAALGIGVYYYYMKAAKLNIENILPGQPLGYLRIAEIEKTVTEFRTSRLWQNIKDIEIEMLMEKSGLSAPDIAAYREIKADITQTSSLILDKFFGQELAMALYSPKISKLESKEELLELASNLILVTRVKPEANIIELVSKLFNKINGKLNTSQEKYKEYDITLIEIDKGLKLGYTKIKDLLVIGLGNKAAKSCIDILADKKPALAKDKRYLEVKSKLYAPARTLAYADIELFFNALKQLINQLTEAGEMTAGQKQEVLDSLAQVEGLKTAGFALASGNIAKNKSVVLFDKSKLGPTMTQAYSYIPQENSTVNFVPKDVLGYQWNNCLDAQFSWDNFQKRLAEQTAQLPSGSSPPDITAGLEEAMGMSLETELIPAIGNENGGILCDINLEGPFPLPELLLFVKITNRGTIEKLMDNLVKQNNLSTSSENYQKAEIKYILLPLGTNLQPAYCFLQEYLLVSTSRKTLKQSIDASQERAQCLLANKDFQSVDLGLTDRNNAVFFLQTDTLLSKVKEVLEWGTNWLTVMSARLEAQQKEAQRYLDSQRSSLESKEQELEWLNTNAQLLQQSIEELKTQGQDASTKQKELEIMEGKIKQTEDELFVAQKDLESSQRQINETMQKSPLAQIDIPLVKLYLGELVYPFLEGLKENRAIGARSAIGKDIVEMEAFFKVER